MPGPINLIANQQAWSSTGAIHAVRDEEFPWLVSIDVPPQPAWCEPIQQRCPMPAGRQHTAHPQRAGPTDAGTDF